MEYEKSINIHYIRKNKDIMDILLKDRTTRKNIIWATNSYKKLGKGYGYNDQLKNNLLNLGNHFLIKPRFKKNIEEKASRTRSKAEVFTPSWIIRKKIDYIEEEFKNLKLEEYISLKWLEITCGEAPYITNRYETISGDMIDLSERAGFLDRKLRKISQDIDDESKWFKLVEKAYKSSYGYEYQGDSLYIARENLLITFLEYYEDKFKTKPDINQLISIATIISYNIFQMDGLKYTIPISGEIKVESSKTQLSFFEDEEEQLEIIIVEGERTKIKNWSSLRMIEFKSLIEGQEDNKIMKFDVVIGNPPYQKTISKTKSQSQANTKWEYYYFQEDAEKIADITCLIYPFGGWFDNHKALGGLGKRILTDRHTRLIKAYEGSDDKRAWYREDKNPNPIFGKDVNLSAGVSIVLRDMRKKSVSYKYYNRIYSDRIRIVNYDDGVNIYPSPEFTFGNKLGKKKLVDRLLKNIFKIESNFAELNPEKVSFNKYDFKNPILLLTNDKSGSAGRATKFYCDESTIKFGRKYIYDYKVIMPSAYPKKALTTGGPNINNVKKRLLELIEIYPPKSAIGRSRMILFNSTNRKEVESFIKYIKTNFFAFLSLQEPNKASTFGEVIPDQDFTSKSDIDWTKSIAEIDQQLYKKYGLSEEEIEFIESNVKEME